MMIFIKDTLDYTVGNNTVLQYIIGVLLFFVVRFVLYGFQKFVIKRVKAYLSGKKESRFFKGKNIAKVLLDFIDGLPSLFFTVFSLIPTFLLLSLPNDIDIIIVRIFIVISSFFLIKLIYKVAYHYIIDVYLPNEDGNPTTINESKKNMLEMVLKIFIWIIGGLFILSNIGIEITPLIASLGVGGIAIGFALQNILSDIFSSFSIFFDKPFQIGEYIKVGDDGGTVLDITFKSTRIQTLDGQILTIPNKDITNSRINNFAHIAKRRAKIELGIIYETDFKKLKKIPDLIRECIEKQERVDIARSIFKGYGDFSINFEAVYYVHTDIYKEFLEINQSINYDIFETFEKEGIEFAYPTQVVKVEK